MSTGEFLGPSRSQQRREALAVLELGERLVALSEARLAQLPIPPELLDQIRLTQRTPSHGARKRQLQTLAKAMRGEDDENLEAIRRQLAHDKADARRETAALHRVEVWRERLIAEGDAALGELLTAHPAADRRHLRQLARNAQDERARGKLPRASRELFRALRELFGER